MSLPILGFATEDTISCLITTIRCPFALVNSDETHEFVKEVHSNLLFSHG